jgi:RNA 2',3'-cyclic 3'-phosphodiesterase
VRLFVGVGVADEVRAALDGALAAFRDAHPEVRWSRPDGWHITLAFIGRVDDERVDEVAAAVDAGVRAASSGPVPLRLTGPGIFGGHALWVGVDDGDGLTPVAAAVRERLRAVGLEVDAKPLYPHVTIGRPRGRDRLPRDLPDEVPTVAWRWTADEVVLYRSHLGRGPASYEAVASTRL